MPSSSDRSGVGTPMQSATARFAPAAPCTNISAHAMLISLRAARADASNYRRLLRYTNPDLLIVDVVGLRPLEHDVPIGLYHHRKPRAKATACGYPPPLAGRLGSWRSGSVQVT